MLNIALAAASSPKDLGEALAMFEEALEAALLAERKAALAGVRVKPLEWVRDPLGRGDFSADTIAGQYSVGRLSDGYGAILRHIVDGGQYDQDVARGLPSVKAAKAAANADYESRIRSALEPGEDRYAEGWKAALAEAAEVAENYNDGGSDAKLFASLDIADNILALSPEGKGPDEGHTYEAPRDTSVTVKVRGVGRTVDEPRALLVLLTERPTDDELRSLHEFLRDWPDDHTPEEET